jgi:hypothetical protein
MRGTVLLGVSILLVLAGVWILNGACAYATLNMPREDQVAAYRLVFYQRASLGIGCILLGIVTLRLRRRGRKV